MSACGAARALPDDTKGAEWGDVTVKCDAPSHAEPEEDVVHSGPIVVDGVFRGVHFWGPGYHSPIL